MKKYLILFVAVAMILAMALPALAVQNVYLKGSGSSFSAGNWQNLFYLGGEEIGKDPNEWHLVYTSDFGDVLSMQLKFTNGEVFNWTPEMGPSVNNGGNNLGWIVIAPYDWEIDYVNSGNNNASNSFLVTMDDSNVNFNISGFNKGTPDDNPPPGELILEKRVDGTIFGEWVLNNTEAGNLTVEEILEIIDSVKFYVYAADEDGNFVEEDPVSIGTLWIDGMITFDPSKLNAGWYAIVEELTGKAAEIFAEVEPLFVEIGEDANPINFSDFDYKAFYTVINGYGGGYTLGYQGLNNTGDIFFIGIKNAETGIEYPSICANAGSTNFAGEGGVGCSGYLVSMTETPNDVPRGDFVKAYNYMYAKYGDLNDIRPVVQIITWALLGAIDVGSEAFENINWAAVEAGTAAIKGVPGAKDMVYDVFDNYKDFPISSGEIADVVFLVCDKHDEGHDFVKCQPQLVPVYGKTVFENKTLEDPEGDITFTKVKNGGKYINAPAIAGEFLFDLFKFKDEVWDQGLLVSPATWVMFNDVKEPFATDENGEVTAKGLKPGLYKFVERVNPVWEYVGNILFEMVKVSPKLAEPVWKGSVTGFGYTVINKPVLGPGYGSVTATNAGNQPSILAGLNTKNGNAVFDSKAPEDPKKSTPFVVPNSNHFVFAKINRADLLAGPVDLDMLVGNKFEIVGKARVELVGNELKITFNGEGKFGAIAFNKLPEPKNGNIHSQKAKDLEGWGAVKGTEFNHDSKALIPCPAGNTIYLYIHCDPIRFYKELLAW